MESKSNFTVAKGEDAPVMGDCGPVSGVAKKQCNMTIPYKVEGEKQSDVEIFVEKDGKILKIGKDVQLTVHGDRIQLDVINPKREKSGVYKVIMKNAQGQDEKDILVNIMDVPTPPLNVRYSDVYQDNLMLHWNPPKDNGGTELKKYIVEALDTTTGNGAWTEVAQTDSGTQRSIKVDHLTPQHKYRFRVRAANKIGPSDPGEMSGDDVLMRDPWGKQHLHNKHPISNLPLTLSSSESLSFRRLRMRTPISTILCFPQCRRTGSVWPAPDHRLGSGLWRDAVEGA